MTGPVAAMVGAADGPPAFPPLPGQAAVTEAQLRTIGGRRELYAVYSGIASGRVVVLGAPGAGKTGTAILLLLDALEHRNSLDDTARARVPVPVLFTAHGWDPNVCSVQDWLSTELATNYRMFQRRRGNPEAAALVTAEKVALILDGLDEMPTGLRSVALQALSDAPFRVVVLTRSQEMVTAARCGWLVEAIAVQLHEVAAPDAADYLQRALAGPPPAGWARLLTNLREHPYGVLARGLSTPLALTLIRDTYRVGDDVSELFDSTKYRTAQDIKQHLVARIVPAAYAPQPGKPLPRYSLTQVHQALIFIAREMNQHHTRDLAWWHIPRWVPAGSRIVTGGLVCWLVFGLVSGLVSELGFVPRLVLGFMPQLVFVLVLELVPGLVFGLGTGEPPVSVNWRAIRSPPVLALGLVFSLAFGLMFGLEHGFFCGFGFGLGAWGGTGLGAALVVGLVAGLARSGMSKDSPQSPREIWRKDRRLVFVLVLVFALVLGFAFVPELGLVSDTGFRRRPGLGSFLAFGSGFGLILGFALVLEFGLVTSETWAATMAWRQLRRSRRVPGVGLMPFLEDARARGILRTVGAVYQFRHATLQDHLAGSAMSSPAASTSGQLWSRGDKDSAAACHMSTLSGDDTSTQEAYSRGAPEVERNNG